MDKREQELLELWRLLKKLGEIYSIKNVKSDLGITIHADASCMMWADQMAGEEYENFQEVIVQLKYEITCEGGSIVGD